MLSFGSRRQMSLVLGLVLSGLSLAQGPPPPTPKPDLKSMAQARLDLAVKQFNETWAYYQQARIDSYQVYVWSKLILDSRTDMAVTPADRMTALDEHLTRMKKLEVLIKKVRRLGFGRSYDVGSSEYYLREAEFWIARARAGK